MSKDHNYYYNTFSHLQSDVKYLDAKNSESFLEKVKTTIEECQRDLKLEDQSFLKHAHHIINCLENEEIGTIKRGKISPKDAIATIKMHMKDHITTITDHLNPARGGINGTS